MIHLKKLCKMCRGLNNVWRHWELCNCENVPLSPFDFIETFGFNQTPDPRISFMVVFAITHRTSFPRPTVWSSSSHRAGRWPRPPGSSARCRGSRPPRGPRPWSCPLPSHWVCPCPPRRSHCRSSYCAPYRPLARSSALMLMLWGHAGDVVTGSLVNPQVNANCEMIPNANNQWECWKWLMSDCGEVHQVVPISNAGQQEPWNEKKERD